MVLTDGYVRLTLGANFERDLLYTSFNVATLNLFMDSHHAIFLLVESRIRQIFANGIRNKVQGIRIPLTIGIRNPRSTDKNSGIHGVESRIQDCLGLSYMGGMENVLKIFQSIYGEKFAPMRRSIVAASSFISIHELYSHWSVRNKNSPYKWLDKFCARRVMNLKLLSDSG